MLSPFVSSIKLVILLSVIKVGIPSLLNTAEIIDTIPDVFKIDIINQFYKKFKAVKF